MSVSVGGDEYDEDTVRKAEAVLRQNVHPRLRSRDDFMSHLGQMYDGDRDVYEVLGYSKNLDPEDYRAKYERQDIAKRIVELPAKDTWREPPEVTVEGQEESEFQREFEALAQDLRLWNVLARADISAGLGEYGILFIGYEDSQPLDEPVNEGALDVGDVAFLTPFAQDHVIEWELGRDLDRGPSDPRYNKPVQYTISFADIDDDKDDEDFWEEVHHSRVLHIAEGRVESDLKGMPRLKPVYNRLEDRQKVMGSSAEMFWAGADRKFQFDIDTEDTGSIDPSALEDLDEEVKKLVHDMEQYIKTFNTDVEVIGGEDPDPEAILNELDKAIAGTTGIPKRMLTGSEQAELASSQDRATWFGRVESRQTRFAEPSMLRPLMDRWIRFGVLPEPPAPIVVEWPNLFELTELEEAEVMKNRGQALQAAAPKKNTDVMGTVEQIWNYVVDGDKPDFEEGDFDVDALPPTPSEVETETDEEPPEGDA